MFIHSKVVYLKARLPEEGKLHSLQNKLHNSQECVTSITAIKFNL